MGNAPKLITAAVTFENSIKEPLISLNISSRIHKMVIDIVADYPPCHPAACLDGFIANFPHPVHIMFTEKDCLKTSQTTTTKQGSDV